MKMQRSELSSYNLGVVNEIDRIMDAIIDEKREQQDFIAKQINSESDSDGEVLIDDDDNRRA